MLIFVLNVFQMDDHVQSVGQDKQKDEGGDKAHKDSRRQESSTVTRRRKFTSSNVEGLNLKGGKTFSEWLNNQDCLHSAFITVSRYVINILINRAVFLTV